MGADTHHRLLRAVTALNSTEQAWQGHGQRKALLAEHDGAGSPCTAQPPSALPRLVPVAHSLLWRPCCPLHTGRPACPWQQGLACEGWQGGQRGCVPWESLGWADGGIVL